MDIAIAAVLSALWAVGVLFFRLNRIWLPYYVLGSVGLAFILIYIGRNTPIEPWLQAAVAYGVHGMAQVLQVPTETFGSSPGSLLVLVDQNVGWTMLQVSVESSGLLESGVVAGMLMFYPAWSLRRRLMYTLIALLLTYVANIVRLMVIVAALHFMGKESLLVSHTIIGRAVFFIAVIAIYWYLLTRPTLGAVRKKLDEELVAS